MYIDGGFQSEDIYKTVKEIGMEIHITNMNGKEPSKKMPVSEFDIDETTNIIKRCPALDTPVRTKVNKQLVRKYRDQIEVDFKEMKGRLQLERYFFKNPRGQILAFLIDLVDNRIKSLILICMIIGISILK